VRMRVLVVSAHPDAGSFNAVLRDSALEVMTSRGHEVRHLDLYAERFDPVFSAYERVNHSMNADEKLSHLPELAPHVEALQWCQALVLCYPTWWSGQPAILKGWFDRVLMKGVAWDLPDGAARLTPKLNNISRMVVITTHGSSKFMNTLQGESGKRTAFRAVRLMFHWRTRCRWIGLYGLDGASSVRREGMIRKVRRRIRRAL
jgi:NAD(P)H dehydrogenase (quinone)